MTMMTPTRRRPPPLDGACRCRCRCCCCHPCYCTPTGECPWAEKPCRDGCRWLLLGPRPPPPRRRRGEARPARRGRTGPSGSRRPASESEDNGVLGPMPAPLVRSLGRLDAELTTRAKRVNTTTTTTPSFLLPPHRVPRARSIDRAVAAGRKLQQEPRVAPVVDSGIEWGGERRGFRLNRAAIDRVTRARYPESRWPSIVSIHNSSPTASFKPSAANVSVPWARTIAGTLPSIGG